MKRRVAERRVAQHRARVRLLPGGVVLAGMILALSLAPPSQAHEGHAPLPTKGATVDGDQLLLSASAAKAVGLKVTKIQLGDLQRTITANATVELPNNHQAYATTMVTGRVAAVLARPGDAVVAGQALATIESVELETLQLEMLQSYETFTLAQRLLTHRESIGSAVSGRVLLETRAERNRRAAQYSIAWQRLRSLGLTPAQLESVRNSGEPVATLAVTSPIAGVVSEADVRVGQMVMPTEHLYHILDRSHLWIVADVLESDSPAMRLGLPARVSIDALPKATFAGEIEYLGLAIDPRRHTLAVRVTLNNAQDELRPGMFGRLVITVASAEQAIVCPAEALLDDGQGRYVLLEDGPGTYLRRPVSLGLQTPDRSEILDGLFPGDRVITTGNHELAALFAARPAKPAASGATPAPVASGADSTAARASTSSDPLVASARLELPTDRKSFATSNVQGKILQLFVERGDRVTAGTVLAEIESLELKNWQLDLLRNRVQIELTQATLDRMQSSGGQGAIPENEILKLRTELQSFRFAQRSLLHKLHMVGLSQDEIDRIQQLDVTDPQAGEQIRMVLPIRAPADGEVARFDLGIGQVINPNEHLFEMHDRSRMWARGMLFEQDAAQIGVGQEVEIQLVSDPSCRQTVHISRTSPIASAGERAIAVWAEVDNADRRLREGMLARMLIRRKVIASDAASESP